MVSRSPFLSTIATARLLFPDASIDGGNHASAQGDYGGHAHRPRWWNLPLAGSAVDQCDRGRVMNAELAL